MLRKSFFLLLFFSTTFIWGQNYNVKINLKDGNIVEGKLLKISAEGVDINPGGIVKYRFISAEKIKSVVIVELNKTIEYPLSNADIPSEIKGSESDYGDTQQGGFPKLLGLCSFGYSSVGGDYYEGLNSGTVLRFGMYYLFHETDPSASRFLIGFSYNHSSITGDKIYNIEPKLLLNEYSFEFGMTTGLFKNGHYLYFLTGLVIVSNNISMSLASIGLGSSEVSYDETKAALRLEGDGSISIGSKFSILISAGYDIVLGPKQANYTNYYTNEPNFSIAGGILNLSIGLTYGF
jgi:hypothetical protein